MVQLEHCVMVEGTAEIRVNGCGGGKLLVAILLLNPGIHQEQQGCFHKQVRLKKRRNLLWEQSGVQASPRVDDDTSQMTLVENEASPSIFYDIFPQSHWTGGGKQ